jgi:hypothetical protein
MGRARGIVGYVVLAAIVLLVAALVALLHVGNAMAHPYISAEADMQGIWVSAPAEMVCWADMQVVEPMGWTAWDHNVVWGSIVLVQCAYPGTTGFVWVEAIVQGQAFLPLIGGVEMFSYGPSPADLGWEQEDEDRATGAHGYDEGPASQLDSPHYVVEGDKPTRDMDWGDRICMECAGCSPANADPKCGFDYWGNPVGEDECDG